MTAPTSSPYRPIATQNEGPLHAGLKQWYALSGDDVEVPLDGRQIDLVRGDLLIEIQTRGFSALKQKLETLVESHRVRLVHPLPWQTWIVRVEDKGGAVLGRRKSPKRGRIEDVFDELVSIPRLIAHPNFSVEFLLIKQEEVRQREEGRWRRKGWAIIERRLIEVIDSLVIETVEDLLPFLPEKLPETFTTADLAQGLDISRDLAQKLAYCLREAGAIVAQGKRGNAIAYAVAGRS